MSSKHCRLHRPAVPINTDVRLWTPLTCGITQTNQSLLKPRPPPPPPGTCLTCHVAIGYHHRLLSNHKSPLNSWVWYVDGCYWMLYILSLYRLCTWKQASESLQRPADVQSLLTLFSVQLWRSMMHKTMNIHPKSSLRPEGPVCLENKSE